ncbi:hypothetical protein [Pantanalinema sp. GBBB05]|uniref:hypothetical protein n=1 Tax=Pantanalinema sp. GBBB05 TaxID=2604139 RepID=UPI001DFB3E64|nr:hypothetical protein [Pantanalinema sp. GBBB05]
MTPDLSKRIVIRKPRSPHGLTIVTSTKFTQFSDLEREIDALGLTFTEWNNGEMTVDSIGICERAELAKILSDACAKYGDVLMLFSA